MVDAFCATWKLVDSQNFDEYMKALGEQVYLFECIVFEIIVNCIYSIWLKHQSAQLLYIFYLIIKFYVWKIMSRWNAL